MRINLTEAEVEELRAQHRMIKDGKSRDRIKAILLFNKGYTAVEISEILMIDETTLMEWKTRYLSRKDNVEWLLNLCKGYSGKLSKLETKKLETYVESNLISDSKQIQKYIRETFKKKYSISGVIALLHRLNFSYKQTTLIPSKADFEKQKEFKKNYDEFAPQLKEDEALLFMDAVHPQHNTACTHAWIKKGTQKTIPSNSGRKRLNINGAYNPFTQDILFLEDKTINAEVVLAFFRQLESFYPNKATIYVVCDQAPYYRDQRIKEFLKSSRIELISLPTYSPNLNLIERLWKLLRKQVISSTYYAHFKDFKKAVFEFLNDHSKDFKALLRHFIGIKLHLFKPS